MIIIRGIDVEYQKNNSVRKKLMRVRPKIDRIMNLLIGVVGEEKEERWTKTFFERIKGEIRTILNFLDNTEDELLRDVGVSEGDLSIYQTRLISIINSKIHAPIDKANQKEDDPDRWVACLWDEMRKSAGLMVKEFKKSERERERMDYEEIIGEKEGEEEKTIREAIEKGEKAEGLLKEMEERLK